MNVVGYRAQAALNLAFVAVAAGGWWVVVVPPSWRGSATMVWHLALTGLMLVGWRLSCQYPDAPQHGTLLAGVLARLLVLALPAFTTHDVERYLWDGAVALAGLDPYRVAPDSPAVANLRAFWPTPAEHAAYPTLYPPGALALFALSATAGPVWGVWVWKLLASAASLATLWVMRDVLVRQGAAQHLPLVALSPLLLLEAGVGAHVDAVSTLALALGLWAIVTSRPLAAGAALGMGALVKLAPLMAALPLAVGLLQRAGWQQAMTLSLALLAVLAGGYGVALVLGLQPVGSLGVFFAKWRGGSPVFAALASVARPEVAGSLAVGLTLAGLAWAARLARTRWVSGLQLALAAPLLFSPVVFPWYLCLLVPALALQPRAWLLAWVSAVPLAYEVLDRFVGEGVWQPADWPLWAVALAWLLGAGVDRWQQRRQRQTRESHVA